MESSPPFARLSNQRGAVDLPSIMVGAIVLGLLTSAILAVVFTVIPWAQDNSAKQEASQVAVAQSSYYAMSPDGLSDPRYADLDGLKAAGLLSESADAERIQIETTNVSSPGGAGQDSWTLVTRSDTGAVFCSSKENPQPTTATSADDCMPTPRMVSTWDPSLSHLTCTTADGDAGHLVKVLIQGEKDATIDWGDGTTESIAADNPEHCYADGSAKTVTVEGTFATLGAGLYGTPGALISVDQWDDGTGTTAASRAFYAAKNLTYVAGIPKSVTSWEGLFAIASKFNQDISNWDTSHVTNMGSMFSSASAFNQDISAWDVSGVTDMNSMFSSALVFDQDISGWNTSKVTDMNTMFYRANAFNRNISAWNVSNVTDMSYMFYSAGSFNQDISGWTVDNVTRHSSFRSSSALSAANTPAKFR